MNDIITFDNILPKLTQQRFAGYVADSEFDWKDYNHILTAGMYFKNLSFSSDAISVPTDASVKLCYYNDFRRSKIFDQTIFWLGLAILDEYSERTNTHINGIMRMKVNNQSRSLTHGYDTNCCNEIHVDSFEPHKTLVYYINDSDGDTFLFDKLWNKDDKHYDLKTALRVTPKMGSAVCFDGHRFHAPSNPIFRPRRYVLNINFF